MKKYGINTNATYANDGLLGQKGGSGILIKYSPWWLKLISETAKCHLRRKKLIVKGLVKAMATLALKNRMKTLARHL